MESFVKGLIDKCGDGGGLIIVIKMPDKTGIDDMKAVLKSVKEYGGIEANRDMY